MKKILQFGFIFALILVLAACGQGQGGDNEGAGNENGEEVQELTVGATLVPHAEILEFVKPMLEEEGIALDIVEFTDYTTPNQTLDAGEIDANFFQHIPYLKAENEAAGYNLVDVVGVHIEPMGAYSAHYDSIEELPQGATILHPMAVSEEGRFLALLESEGLITLEEGVGFNGTVDDIVDNPKELEFTGVEAATLPALYQDGDLAIINTNYALEAGLSPAEDALILESPDDNPFVNVVATIEGQEDDPRIQALVEAITSEEVRQFIEENYEGNVIPAF
ncbi:MetQ/NlpA family ABC transporter substrate-binding protein [Caldalkalibacillus salinus]|uniref:MetQ/NlpA family ABC transporter substrate-binding protein n=1 Tax=Caldalkalibacillus salinus TaxID=2803787 RepID=UPI00192304CE|nr:MetQ/NlpA family ABC transporter substrate-binding protein [Caldalkalibacillus salinus]